MSVLHVQKVAGISGSEAHLLQLLPDLKARGWDIRFLMLHEDEPGAWEFARELESGGVPVDGIAMHNDVDPGTFVRVLAYLVEQRPTILHTHLIHADAYGQTAGTLAGVPIRLSTKHGFNEFREGRIFALGDRTIGALANRQIAISRGLARYLAETEGFAEPDFEIVHYGIAAGPEPAPYVGEAPHFLCIGRLIPIKGHVVLLRAFRAVLDVRPDARLDIAGRGVLEHGLKDLARELGLNGAVRFLGHVSPVQAAIEQSTAVVVPSLGEGFGMVAARGDGARTARDRRLDRRPRGPGTRRRDRPARPSRGRRLARRRRCSPWPPIRRARSRWAGRPAAARSRASRRPAAPSGRRRSTATCSPPRRREGGCSPAPS